MTVCIAAACDNGERAVIATDGLLSCAGVIADSIPGKVIWLDDWLIMYAGEPGNVKLIFEEIHKALAGKKITRQNVQQLVSKAYQSRRANYLTNAVLSQ